MSDKIRNPNIEIRKHVVADIYFEFRYSRFVIRYSFTYVLQTHREARLRFRPRCIYALRRQLQTG